MTPLNNEKGAVLVVALIITGLLMVLGTTIVMTSSIELNIARNEKVAKTAFYRAENGRVIATNVTQSAAWGTDYNDGDNFEGNTDITITDGDFIMEAKDDADTAFASPDVQLTGSLAANVDIDRRGTALSFGGAAEFGSGYEGAGKSGAVEIICLVDSIGSGLGDASSRIQAEYRLIPQ